MRLLLRFACLAALMAAPGCGIDAPMAEVPNDSTAMKRNAEKVAIALLGGDADPSLTEVRPLEELRKTHYFPQMGKLPGNGIVVHLNFSEEKPMRPWFSTGKAYSKATVILDESDRKILVVESI